MISASGTGSARRRSLSASSSANEAPSAVHLPVARDERPFPVHVHLTPPRSGRCAFRPFAKILAKYPALPGLRLLPMMPPPREECPASDASAALAIGEWKVNSGVALDTLRKGAGRRHRRRSSFSC